MTNKTFEKSFFLFLICFSFFKGFSQSPKKANQKINYSKISVSEAKKIGLPTIDETNSLKLKTTSHTKKGASSNRKKMPNGIKAKSLNAAASPQISINSLKPNKITIPKYKASSSKTTSTKRLVKGKNYKQLSVRYSKKKIPKFISSEFIGEISNVSKKGRNIIINEYLEEFKEILMISSPSEEFEIKEENIDKLGLSHIKFEQVFNNIPVYAKEIIVHLDKRGIVKSLNGSYIATPEGVSTDPKLNPKIIIDKLPKIFDKSLLELKKHNDAIEPTLVIYEKNDQLFLSWYITIYSSQLDRWNLFVDDKTGEILDKIYTTCNISADHNHDKKKPKISNKNKENKKLATGTGVDLNGIQRNLNTFFYDNTYWLVDITKQSYNPSLSNGLDQKGGLQTLKYNSSDGKYYYIGNQNNTFDDSSLVSAHYNASLVYDYFIETHDRNSIDGRGGSVYSHTNMKDEDGDDVDNAYWNGKGIYYGNGKTGFTPLAGSLDVAAHEVAHGVVEWTAGLEYKDEAGALNESFSDIFGVMVDRDDWTVGEDIVKTESYPNGCLRSLQEPELGDQPSHYDDAVYLGTDIDYGGVHYNSGIPNKAFYLIATEMGKGKAEQIFYRALSIYLTRSSDFLDLRIGLEQSAIDIYGSNSTELAIVKQGLNSVGILFEQIEEEDRIEVDGTDYILSYDTDPDNTTTFYASDPFGDEFLPLSETKIWSKPSISSDGFFLVFVTEDNNLNGMSLIENNIFEYTIDDTGVWNTVSISKDKSKIALTTVNEGDKNIYVYDLKNDKWGTFELYTPTTAQGEVKSDQIVYADALEWDNRSERIIFDQLNRIKRVGSEDLEYWDIGIMDVWNSEKNKFASGSIIRLYSQIPENVNIGFPSFAKTTNDVVAFDYIEQIDGEYYPYVVLLDIETSEFGFFESNSSDWAVPNFATLDNQIIYNQLDSGGISDVYSRQVDDMILPSDQETLLISYADWGLWFNQGQRDFDKDGVQDDIDKCPNSPEGVQVDDDGCAVSQKDTDQDGINDDTDNCIETPNPDQLDTDGDGIGDECDEDDDGDGVEDERDLCPNTPIDSIVDLNGCKIFSLPVNNYSISVAEISCAGENDGLITFSVEDKTYDYIATISNKSSSKRLVNSSKNALSCTPSISFVGSNVQTVGQGENVEEITFVVTNTCSLNYSKGILEFFYNGELLSLSQWNADTPFEEAGNPFIRVAALGNDKGKLCDGTFICMVNFEPGTANTTIFKGKLKNDAKLGEYVLIDGWELTDGTRYTNIVTITVVEAGSTGTTSSTNSGNSTDTSSTGESIQLNPSNNHSGNFKNLEPGVYDICLKVIGEDGYEQCFELMVKEPQPLSASSKIDKTAKSVQFNLSGSRFYYIYHNDELKVVESNNPTIKLKSGLNFIKISTDKSCQGTYSEEFFISEKVEYYPNPTINNVYFYIHGEDEFVDITVVDATGNLYKNCVEEIPSSRKVQVNFGNFYKGVYVVRLKGKTVDKTIKIIKE